jgi:hypothetical protein
MTTIAWDGKTLAADRASTQGYIVNEVCKIRSIAGGKRIRGQRYAALTGDAHICEAMLAWLLGAEMIRVPDADWNKACGLIVTIDRRIFRMAVAVGTFEEILSVPFADGGGSEMALGAMLAGADAKRAIELVALRAPSLSWGGVDVVTL